MRKLLLIEDDGMLTRHLENELSVKYEVKKAYSYASATGLWKKYKEQIVCIILDLNINPNGLEEENVDKYFPIHGILFLKEICTNKTPEELQQIWNKTIIYSAYLDILRNKSDDFLYYNLLKLIPKTGTSIHKLLLKVDEVVKSNLQDNEI